MKDVIKKIVAVLVIVAIVVGIYFVLPEYPQSFVKGMIQPKVDGAAKKRIEAVQNMKCKDVDDLTYREVLTKNVQTTCWVYVPAGEIDNSEHVFFYGRGASVNLKKWTDYGTMMYTSAIVKVDFKISGNNVDIVPYIENLNKPLHINDALHYETNKEFNEDFFSQIYRGMKSDN